ncbi:RNA-guided endonuclease TnpB family protein [Herbidospora cretacea]|uniref:RNA-guided endonuclease InsQ/TnpB family protein n=1 Tax=Herbidospora cretacea TaxID=28444 RepID=UPI000773F237|nr:RNA-guided endonuclease TnpB family protein [Herbidospora cretacea]
MAQTVKRAYKYRFYPTSEQAEELSRTFGCVRLVYNKALEERTRAYAEGRKIGYEQSLRHLQTAYANFFAGRARHPVAKSRKRSRRSAEYTRSAFTWLNGELKLAKMRKPLAIVWSRPLPEGAQPSTVHVSQDTAGRWFVSILVEERIRSLDPAGTAVGVDVGITDLVTLSTGEKIANPRHAQAMRRKLTRAHRTLTRKKIGSRNRAKARLTLAKTYARMTDRRRDFLHKLSTRLVRENQTVVIEDLSVRSMLRNRTLSRAISDASWRELRAMLEYKTHWYGRELLVVSQWFPSSKMCSNCGALRETLPLKVRTWVCDCGVTHDRDVNAARNILAAGLAERSNARGADVRPQGASLSGSR